MDKREPHLVQLPEAQEDHTLIAPGLVDLVFNQA